MIQDFGLDRPSQLVLERFVGLIVQHRVEHDEFCKLLLSRRTLERCNDELRHRYGLFDPQSGELFAIDEADLCVHDGMKKSAARGVPA